MSVQRSVCVVDAYSSGSLLPQMLAARGFRTVHVQTRDPIPGFYATTYVASDHAMNIVFDGDFERCRKAVASEHPVCVIAGAEPGVPFADRLSEALGLTTNGSLLSDCRRRKFEMQKRLLDCGVRGIPSLLASDWPTARSWIETHDALPVVLKPPASAGTDGVVTCRNMADAEQAFEAIRSTIDIIENRNDAVVVQPFIEGDEYIVNAVSCAGHHSIISIWKVEKRRTQHTVYDAITLMDWNAEHQEAIRKHVCDALNALEIRFGPSHTELFWTSDGPRIIEVAARFGGQRGGVLVAMANGRSIFEAALDCYLHPQRFFETYMTPYALRKQVTRVELIAPRTGVLAALPRLDEIRALPSFEDMSVIAKIGAVMKQTTDFLTVPIFVDLVHDDAATIQRDREQIREIESSGFYVYADS